MKKILLTIFFIFAISFFVIANLVNDKNKIDGLIIPGEKLYGLEWNFEIEKLPHDLGYPNAIIEMKSNEKMLIYGQKVILFFSNGEFCRVSLGYNWLPPEISAMFEKQKLDDVKWYLPDAIKEGTSLKTVEDKLGEKLYNTSPDDFMTNINHYDVSLIFASGISPRYLVGCVISKSGHQGQMLLNQQKYTQSQIINNTSIFGIPYGSGKDVITEKLNYPQGEFQFAPRKTGLLYGKYILLLQDKKLSGIYIDNRHGKFPFFSLGKELPPLPEWNFHDITEHSSQKYVLKQLEKYLKNKFKEKMIFSTEKLNIVIGLQISNSHDKPVSYILIHRK